MDSQQSSIILKDKAGKWGSYWEAGGWVELMSEPIVEDYHAVTVQDHSEQLIPTLSRTASHACHTLLECWQVQAFGVYQYVWETAHLPPLQNH